MSFATWWVFLEWKISLTVNQTNKKASIPVVWKDKVKENKQVNLIFRYPPSHLVRLRCRCLVVYLVFVSTDEPRRSRFFLLDTAINKELYGYAFPLWYEKKKETDTNREKGREWNLYNETMRCGLVVLAIFYDYLLLLSWFESLSSSPTTALNSRRLLSRTRRKASPRFALS